jgi:hypothetical protein
MGRSYTSSPPKSAFVACSETALAFVVLSSPSHWFSVKKQEPHVQYDSHKPKHCAQTCYLCVVKAQTVLTAMVIAEVGCELD